MLGAARDDGSSVGLVTTMGALHQGHLSLVEAAHRDCDFVTVTIFVNPTQFGEAADLAAYPRDLGADLLLCEQAGVDAAFAPSTEEMYPSGPPATVVSPGPIASTLEGASRPGHFAGVATVLTKLFTLAGECTAYFGEKDYQQLVVVRQLVHDLDLPVAVRGCPTVREPDGLALSSRNRWLSHDGRVAALSLWRALGAGRLLVEGGESDAGAVEAAMLTALGASPLVVPDYAVAADPISLEPVETLENEVRLLVAGRVESVRLIDNVAASVKISA
ncbi:MAG: pantoate--beta-alanine ligase [Acidimicrobiales bacterium]